jgi:hypothetical protein
MPLKYQLSQYFYKLSKKCQRFPMSAKRQNDLKYFLIRQKYPYKLEKKKTKIPKTEEKEEE